MDIKKTIAKRSDITQKKKDLSEALHLELGLARDDSLLLINQIFEHISGSLVNGENVKIAKFGTFQILNKKERLGRNITTGDDVRIQPRKVVVFKASPAIKTRIHTALLDQGIDKVSAETAANSLQLPEIWGAILKLIGLLTSDGQTLNPIKETAFIKAALELSVVLEFSVKTDRRQLKHWLRHHYKSFDVTKLDDLLKDLSPLGHKLDLLTSMLKISLSTGTYTNRDEDIIKKAILVWKMPVERNQKIETIYKNLVSV